MQRLYDENPFEKGNEVGRKIWFDKVQQESAGLWEQIDEEEKSKLKFDFPFDTDN
jgi:hypothetical protein